MDPISIGMMILGSALQAKSAADAAAAQKRAAVQAQQRQLAFQNQATEAAAQRAREFQPEERKQREDQATQQLTERYQQAAAGTPITAQGVQVGSTVPEGSGTTDYLAAKAREATKATEANRRLAALLGRIGGASQLRRDEAVGIGDTAGQIGRIQSGAGNVAGIDQIAIDSAGQPSVGSMLVGQALSAYGKGKAALPPIINPYQAPESFRNGSWLVGPQ